MATKQDHNIFRFRIDFSIDEGEDPYGIQNQISKICNNGLQSQMEELFSEFVDPDELIRIPQLELDLGDVPLDDLERALPAKVMEALEDALRKRLRQRSAALPEATSPTAKKPGDTALHFLEFYLRSGGTPWWKPSSFTRSPQQLIEQLIETAGEDLRAMLLSTGRLERVRQRLARHFKDATLRQLIPVLEPEKPDTVLEYADDLEEQHQQQPIVPAGHEEFRLMKWELILSHLILERGTTFNTKAYLKSLITGFAVSFQMTYEQLLKQLAKAVQHPEMVDKLSGSLVSVVLELWREADPSQKGISKRSKDRKLTTADSGAAATLQVLQKRPKGYRLSYPQLMARLGEKLRSQPGQFKKVLLDAGRSARLRKMLVEKGSDAFLSDLISLLAPEAAAEQQLLERLFLQLEQTYGQFSQTPLQLKRQLRRWLLDHLLLEKGSTYSLKVFLKSLHHKLQAIGQSAALIFSRLQDILQQQDDHPEQVHRTFQEALDAFTRLATLESPVEDSALTAMLQQLSQGEYHPELWDQLIALPQQLTPADAAQLQLAIQRYGRDPLFRKSLLKDAGMRHWQTLSALLVKAWGNFLPLLDKDLFYLLQTYLPASQSMQAWEQLFWQHTFDLLLVERAGLYGQRQFVDQLLAKLAYQYEKRVWLLHLEPKATEDVHRLKLGETLVDIFHRLRVEQFPDVAVKSSLKDPKRLAQLQDLKQLEAWLLDPSVWPQLAPTAVATVIDRLLQSAPRSLRVLLFGVRKPWHWTPFLSTKLPLRMQQALVKALLPGKDLLPESLAEAVHRVAQFLEHRAGGFSQFESLFWELLLEGAVLKPGRSVSQLIEQTIAGIAQQQGLSTAQLQDLLEAMPEAPFQSFFPDLARVSMPPFQAADLQAIEKYLLTGHLPPGMGMEVLKELLLAISRAAPEQVRSLLGSLKGQPTAFKRLLALFSVHELTPLVLAFLPLEQPWTTALLKEVQVLHQQLQQMRTGPRQLATVWGEALLQVMGESMVSSPRQLIEQVLARIAQMLSLKEAQLYQYLQEAMLLKEQLDVGTPLIGSVVLHRIAQQLPPEQQTPVIEDEQAPLKRELSPQDLTFLLQQYLKQSSTPTIPGIVIPLVQAKRLLDLLQASREDFIVLMKPILKSKKQQQQLLSILSEPVAMVLLEVWRVPEQTLLRDLADTLQVYRTAWSVPSSLPSPPVWGLILGQWLAMRGTLFNQMAFLKQFLKKAAVALSLDYGLFLNRLLQVIQQMGDHYRDAGSLVLLSKVVAEELERIGLVEELPEPPPPEAKRHPKEKPYRKLWDVDKDETPLDVLFTVDNAGLVLLWPYLGRYFEVLGLTKEEGGFIHEEARHRAVFLLQYLASGSVDTEEFELVLNKILCGIPVVTPLPITTIQLSEQEMEMTNSLIQTAISYWTTIGETTIDTFRESFLMREGVIGTDEKGWVLEVAPKSYDLLLRTLPWSISVVNLSWMERLMRVEWK